MISRIVLLFAGLLLISTCNAQNPAATPVVSKWESGKHYQLINPPQPTASGNQVEVIEVFSYACPHCAHFQPYAEQLKAALPKGVVFNYMPALFQPAWEPYARAFYTAQSFKVVDKGHQALFDAIHRDHKPLRTIEDLAGFYADYGVKSDAFLATANSFVIESQLQRASDMVRNYGVDGTPTVIVNGKYRVAGNSENGVGYPEMVEIVTDLVKQELAAKKTK